MEHHRRLRVAVIIASTRTGRFGPTVAGWLLERAARRPDLEADLVDLAEQRSIYYQRPGFAAIPGRSNHGLGQALDLCGGIQSQGTTQFNWLEANSRKYGWFHPAWAYSSPFEPWHWEFGTEAERE